MAMSIGSIGPSLTARMWHLFLPKRLSTAPHHTCFQQLSRQSSATACFNNSNGSSELSIKIVNFHPTEAGLTSKWGRISPGVYRWHQKQSIYVLRPCLNVVIIQCVWLFYWKHRWRFWFFYNYIVWKILRTYTGSFNIVLSYYTYNQLKW